MQNQSGQLRRGALSGAFACALFGATTVHAEGDRGYFSIEYQHVVQESFYFSDGDTKLDFGGDLVARTLQFDLYYNLNDRWSVSLGVPVVSKRYEGPIAHNPLTLDNPRPDNKFLDNGEWQTSIANIELGLYRHFQYRDMTITPFVLLEIPSHPYEFFGLAAPGDGLEKGTLGLQLATPIGLSNFYTRMEYSYTFVEEAPGSVNVDHHRFQTELGYFFSPRFTGRVFALGRVGNGLNFPEDYPSLTDEVFYYHDQTMSHEFVNVGAGVEYQVNERYSVSTWMQEIVWGRNTNTNDLALYFQIGFSF